MTELAYDYDSSEFPGKQDDERILYIITPHALPKWILVLKTAVIAVLIGLVLYYLASPSVGLFPEEYLLRAWSLVAIASLLYLFWRIKLHRIRTYLTDRRIVRTDNAFPFLRRKRTLFWSEAARAKASSPNLFFRIARVGRIEVVAKHTSEESVEINHVYYFDDLANYIDKILHISHTNPADIASIKPFVARPKGKRS